MAVDHENICTYPELIRNADADGRIAVAMKDYERSTGYSMSQLEAMPGDARARRLLDAVFSPFVVSLHKYAFAAGGGEVAALAPDVIITQDAAVFEFSLATALGLPGANPGAELAELRHFIEHWVELYRRHATIRGGTVQIWSAGSSCTMDWNPGDSGLAQATVAEISAELAKRLADSRILTSWVRRLGQGLCFDGQYSRYNCCAQDILGEEESMLLPIRAVTGR